MSVVKLLSVIEELFGKFSDKIQHEYSITQEEIDQILKDIEGTENNKKLKPSKKAVSKKKKETNEEKKTCISDIKTGKRKGELCGIKVSDKSTTGNYCTRHLKCENAVEKVSEKEEITGPLFRKNKYGNFVYGDTGLMLKSNKEQIVIGKQLQDGNIEDLTDEDIEVCKRNKFKFVREYSKKLAK